MKLSKTYEKLFSWLSVIIIFSLVYIFQTKHGNDYKKKILNKHAFANGQVTNIKFVARQGYIISYHFQTGNEIFYGEVNHGKVGLPDNLLLSKTFPVIYSTVNPDYNMLLYRPDDFKDFDIPFPDSLHWELEYFKQSF